MTRENEGGIPEQFTQSVGKETEPAYPLPPSLEALMRDIRNGHLMREWGGLPYLQRRRVEISLGRLLSTMSDVSAIDQIERPITHPVGPTTTISADHLLEIHLGNIPRPGDVPQDSPVNPLAIE